MLRTGFVELIAFVVLSCSMAGYGQEPARQLAQPTPEQVAWQDMEIGMFIHFGSRTWTGSDKVPVELEKVNPSELDTDQWVAAAEAMGAKYIVLWPSTRRDSACGRRTQRNLVSRAHPGETGEAMCSPIWLNPAANVA